MTTPRIYRAVSHWTHVSAIIAGGGKPDPDDINFLLSCGEPVPPDVQAYLARAPRGKGRPSKLPGQPESDQWVKARALFDAIQEIRTAPTAEGHRALAEVRACAAYAKTEGLNAESVERRYRAAKRKLLRSIPRDDAGAPAYFLTAEDHISWEKTNLKKGDK